MSEQLSGEEFVAALRKMCQERKCKLYYKCHRMFSPGAATSMNSVQYCQNPEIKVFCADFFKSNEALQASNQAEMEYLRARANQELYQTATIPEEGTEIHVYRNEPSPVQASKKDAWWKEITKVWQSSQTVKNIQAQKLIDSFTAQFENTKADWKASFDVQGSKLSAILIPDFKTPNKNNFIMSPTTKKGILQALNSGKLPLRDTHGRKLKDTVGRVTSGHETADGKIVCEAEVSDEKISKILKESHESIGVSLAGPGEGYCSECNKKVEGVLSGCPKHRDAPIVVKNFTLREVSLTDSPAFEKSKIISYEE